MRMPDSTVRKVGLAPVIDANTRVLILGSLPGDESLRLQQYYANPRNHFWPIMADVLSFDLELPYEERLQALRARGVGLWDVLHSAERKGSLDGNIVKPVVNDFDGLTQQCPRLQMFLLNGSKSEVSFRRNVLPSQTIFAQANIPFRRCPSTSPVPGRNVPSYLEKLGMWRNALEMFLS